jgi:hypothetical protein
MGGGARPGQLAAESRANSGPRRCEPGAPSPRGHSGRAAPGGGSDWAAAASGKRGRERHGAAAMTGWAAESSPANQGRGRAEAPAKKTLRAAMLCASGACATSNACTGNVQEDRGHAGGIRNHAAVPVSAAGVPFSPSPPENAPAPAPISGRRDAAAAKQCALRRLQVNCRGGGGLKRCRAAQPRALVGRRRRHRPAGMAPLRSAAWGPKLECRREAAKDVAAVPPAPGALDDGAAGGAAAMFDWPSALGSCIIEKPAAPHEQRPGKSPPHRVLVKRLEPGLRHCCPCCRRRRRQRRRRSSP